eukprot:3833064-Pleurochrysis_carterae.AAC.5
MESRGAAPFSYLEAFREVAIVLRARSNTRGQEARFRCPVFSMATVGKTPARILWDGGMPATSQQCPRSPSQLQ